MKSHPLLAELDRLSHDERIQCVVKAVRAPGNGADALAALDALAAGEAWSRWLAVAGAGAIDDVPRLQAALDDPSVRVRLAAAAQLGRCGPPAVLAEVAGRAGRAVREVLLSNVVHFGRRDAAALLVSTLEQPRDVARLIPLCDREVASQLLRRVELNMVPWRRLARQDIDQVLAELCLALDAPVALRPVVWATFAQALDLLADQHPTALLDRLAEGDASAPLPDAVVPHLGRLAAADPERVAALLLAPGRVAGLRWPGLPRALLPQLRRFSPTSLDALAAALAENPGRLADMLLALPPSAREACFRAAFPETEGRVFPDELLEVLPHAVRHVEATRMLGLRAVQDSDERRLTTVAFQHLASARPVLEAAANAAKAEDRAFALARWVACAGRNLVGLGEVILHLERLRNEQDPVRLAALSALAQVAATRFEDAHVPALEALVTFALEARDTSYATRYALQGVAQKCMQAHPPTSLLFQLGLRTLARLEPKSTLEFPRLDTRLPRGAEARIVEVVLPWLKRETGGRYRANVLALAQALGRRAWGQERLQDLLGEAIWARDFSDCETAARLWLAAPATRDARVRALLDRDKSAIALTPVFAHAHRRRQAWLDPYLPAKRLQGRFLGVTTRHQVPAKDGFQRWLARQQRAFATDVYRTLAKKRTSQADKVEQIKLLAAMPVTTVADLQPWLASTSVVLVEAALGALVWLDAPAAALPVLLDNLDSDRARVAMYAMPRLTRLLTPDLCVAELASLLARPRLKLTVHKEALRLLGTLATPAAVDLLMDQWARPGLHRDLRIAGLHATRGLLDLEAAWALMGDAASSPERDVPMALLAPQPGTLPRRHQDRYLGLLLGLRTHPELRVRTTLFEHMQRPEWSAGREDRVAPAAADTVIDRESGPAWLPALTALMSLVPTPAGAAAMMRAVEGLVAWAASADPRPLKEDDQPARTRLEALARILAAAPSEALRPCRLEVVEQLKPLPGMSSSIAALRVAALDPTDPTGAVLVVQAALAAATERETRDIELALPAVAGHQTPWTARGLWALVDGLMAGDFRSRFAALALMMPLGHRFGPSATARKRLGALRCDPDPQVRAAALGVRWG